MSWLRLQWRGALVALTAWAGLAAAQSLPAQQNSPYLPAEAPEPSAPAAAPNPPMPPITSLPETPPAGPAAPAAPAAPEHIVTLHENGKAIRCRIVQTWQLTDGTKAHQLQAIDTGELITVLDDVSAPPPPGKKGLAQRIFHWGAKNQTPPPGAPQPPIPAALMVDSGVVVTKEINPPPPGGTVVPVASGRPSPYFVGDPHPGPTLPPGTPVGVASGPVCSCDCVPGTVVGPSLGSNTNVVAASGSCPPCACLPDPCAPGTCPPAGMIVEQNKVLPPPRTTLFGKVQSWFAPKDATTATTAQKDVKVATATVPPPLDSSMSITTPSTAQPAHTEQVAALSTTRLVKPFLGISAPTASSPPSDIAQSKDNAPPPDLVTVKPVVKQDILTAPEKFMPSDDKLKAKGVAVVPTKNEMAAISGMQGLPPGSASVLAARNGMDGPVAYVPITPMVMPKPWRAPVPPDPKMPDAPQLNAFVNAFTPPMPPRGQEMPQFNNPGAMAMNGYGQMPYPPMMGYGPQGGMMPPYAMNPYGPPPYAMANPYMAPQGMPYGYYPGGYPMMPPRTAVDTTRQYQGPLPPDPFGTNVAPPMVQQVGYTYPPMDYPQVAPMAAPMAAPASPSAAPVPAAQLTQLLDLLHDSPYPAQRELAANYLAGCDWRTNPQIAMALITSAKQDPAPTVRAGCISNLMRMNVANEAYRRVLAEMRTDADPRVREAVEQALLRIGQVQTSARAN